jgi:maltose/moltooligosaccharide transporter
VEGNHASLIKLFFQQQTFAAVLALIFIVRPNAVFVFYPFKRLFMSITKPRLSFWQIWNMSFGFLGIQYSFGLQQSAVNPIYSFLGANPDDLPILNLAGPMTGLLIQPIIGALSDKTWHPKWGRRKPYFLVGAMMCSIALLLFPFSSSLWMAAGLLWVLDAGNNTAMEPYRAFVADKLPRAQFATGFMMQSFFTGLGITLANVCLYFFEKKNLIPGKSASGIPYWVYIAFFIGSACSITTVLWSVIKTPEIPPTEEELQKLKSGKHGIVEPFKEIFSAIKNMPKVMWQLAAVYMFQWYGMFCYWQFVSHSVARSVWNTTSKANPVLYSEAAGWASLLNASYNVVTFLTAFGLAWYAKKVGAKWVHAVAVILAGIGLICLPQFQNKYWMFLSMIGLGIGWASMMGIPYLLVVDKIPKERYGVYMGIINMMIVLPMLIQTLTFGFVYKNFLGGNPGNAIAFAGIFLVIAALLTLFIRSSKTAADTAVRLTAGH